MDLSKISSFNALSQQMKYYSARQEAISQNIANADTPGYIRNDITQPSFGDSVKSATLQLATTDPKHFHGNSSSTGFTPKSTGEQVQLDMEAMKLAKNNGDYSRVTATYRKLINLFDVALGDNSQ